MRSFTVINVEDKEGLNMQDSLGGRYLSKDPSSAAKKAGSSICRQNYINDEISFELTLRDTTKSEKTYNQVYTYNYMRLYNPKTVMRSGKKIAYKFKSEVERL